MTIAELRALFRNPVAVWGFASVLVVSVIGSAIAELATISPDDGSNTAQRLGEAFAIASAGVYLFAVAAGADAMAGEWGRGTIGALAAIYPRRGRLIAAKSLATGSFSCSVAAASGIAAGGSVILIDLIVGHRVSAESIIVLLAGIAGLVISAALISIGSLAIGSLTRQRAAGLLTPIFAIYVLPVVLNFAPDSPPKESIASLIPSTALRSLISTRDNGRGVSYGVMIANDTQVTFGIGALVLAAWCLGSGIWAAISFMRRDVVPMHSGRNSRIARAPYPLPSSTRVVMSSSFGGRFRSEIRKLTSLPSVGWIIAIAAAVELAFGAARAATGSLVGVGATLSEGLEIEFAYAITAGVGGLALLMGIAATVLVTSEFETGTAAFTYLAAPRRWGITGPKILAAGIYGAVISLPALILAATVALLIYHARGFAITTDLILTGTLALARAALFLFLIALMSAGIAGVLRRSTTTLLTVIVLIVIAPAAFNTVLGFARTTAGPLVLIGNFGRFLPWEGATFAGPTEDPTAFANIGTGGVLEVSSTFGIAVTAGWAALALIGWLTSDRLRAIRSL